MEIIEYELNRYTQLKKDVDNSPNTTTTPSTPPVSRLPLPRSARKPAVEKKKSPTGRYIILFICFNNIGGNKMFSLHVHGFVCASQFDQERILSKDLEFVLKYITFKSIA